jgi:hypothetical protein
MAICWILIASTLRINVIVIRGVAPGCGDWNEYETLLEKFAERAGESSVSVILYRLGQ